MATPHSSTATTPGAAPVAAPGPATNAAASASSTHSAVPVSTVDAPATNPASPQTRTMPTRTKDTLKDMSLDQYFTRQELHKAATEKQAKRTDAYGQRVMAEIEDYRALHTQYRDFFPPSRLYGEGYNGFANGHTDTGNAGPRIVYPQEKRRPGNRNTPPLKWSKKDMRQQAEQHEELVPVRIDVDYEKVKLRDTFTWNLHDRLVNIDLFSHQLLEDLGLTPVKDPTLYQPVHFQVKRQIHEQLADFYPSVYSEEDALDPELPYSAYKNDEMRILVKLNITIGMVTLVDQFEWEINNPMNSPEVFANNMARDLSLPGEFTTAIAHCIREQSQLFTKSLYSIGHPFDGRPVEDPDLVSAFLPSPIPTVFRPQQQAKEYAPYLYELSEADMERNEVIFSREQRRQKRSVNRRGGPQLPDLKERQRTIRTLVISSVVPGAATSVEESRLYKKAVTGPTGRKARDVSDSEDSEDSAPDSPAMSQMVGTARTRGMRGAATAAQQRMANLGRSETPEAASIIHHHETRVSRRFNPRDARESTEDLPSHVVKLTISRDRLRRILAGERIRPPARPGTPATARTASISAAPPSAQGAMRPPPLTPATSSQNLPETPGTAAALPPGQFGRVAAPRPPIGEPAPIPPPVPDWLVRSLEGLQKDYPHDLFEGTMRYTALKAATNQVVQAPPPDAEAPADLAFFYLPRIRCLDCPGKVYTPGPETSVANFEVHLKNRFHREKVDQRVGKSTDPKKPSALQSGAARALPAASREGASASPAPPASASHPPQA